QISSSKSQSNAIGRVLSWSFYICDLFGIWELRFGISASASAVLDLFVTVPIKRRKRCLVLVKNESRNLRHTREPSRLRSGKTRFRFHGALLRNLHRNVLE